MQLMVFPQMPRSRIAEIRAWGMGNQQVPLNTVLFPVHRFENANRHLSKFYRVPKDVPLRMPAGRLLNVAGIRLMPQRSERLSHFLRFLAGN